MWVTIIVFLIMVVFIEGSLPKLWRRRRSRPLNLEARAHHLLGDAKEVEHHGLVLTLHDREIRFDCAVPVPERLSLLEIGDTSGIAVYGKNLGSLRMLKTKNEVFNGAFSLLNKLSSETLDIVEDPEVQSMLLDLSDGLDAVWIKDGELRFPISRQEAEVLDITAEFLVETFSRI